MIGNPSSDSYLLAATLSAIGLLLFLILYLKIHAFFALLFSSIVLALATRMSPQAILGSLEKGMAELLGSIAVIVGVGALMGRLIAISHGGDVIASRLTRTLGGEKVPWAMLFVTYLVAIPVFFDVAFVTLIPLVWSLSKESKKSELLYALPLLSALTAVDGLVPTQPGPAAACRLLGASFGHTVLYGIALAIPMMICGGIVYGRFIGGRIFVAPPENLMPKTEAVDESIRRPSFSAVLSVVVLPVILISFAVLAPLSFSVGSRVLYWLTFLGHPFVALLLAVVLALVVLGTQLGFRPETLMRHSGEALNSMGSLILIIGASGAFKQILLDSGAGKSFVNLMLRTNMSPLLMAFLTAAALRIALGSATASIATAGGIVAPIAAPLSDIHRVLMVMAVATGGSITSHLNDSGFWMVKEYCGMTVSQTLKTYSVMKAVTSLVGLAILLILSRFV